MTFKEDSENGMAKQSKLQKKLFFGNEHFS